MTPVADAPRGATESMLAGMTVGELKDMRCPHNARIEAALEAAQLEIANSKGRSVWDDFEADTTLIGRGAFARVFKAIRRSDGSPIAIKVIGRDTKAFPQQRRGEELSLVAVLAGKMQCSQFVSRNALQKF